MDAQNMRVSVQRGVRANFRTWQPVAPPVDLERTYLNTLGNQHSSLSHVDFDNPNCSQACVAKFEDGFPSILLNRSASKENGNWDHNSGRVTRDDPTEHSMAEPDQLCSLTRSPCLSLVFREISSCGQRIQLLRIAPGSLWCPISRRQSLQLIHHPQ